MMKKVYLYFFKRDEFLKRILKGKCKQCGVCCRHLLGFIICPFLKNNNKCRIQKFKPKFCRLTPINIEQRNNDCGFK